LTQSQWQTLKARPLTVKLANFMRKRFRQNQYIVIHDALIKYAELNGIDVSEYELPIEDEETETVV